jgi:hypothetical protein
VGVVDVEWSTWSGVVDVAWTAWLTTAGAVVVVDMQGA